VLVVKKPIKINWQGAVEATHKEVLENKGKKVVDAHFDRYQNVWKALAMATVKQRIYLGFNGPTPILIRTGELRKEVTKNPVEVSGNIGKIWSDYPIAVYQNKTRPIMQLDSQDSAELVAEYQKAFASKLNGK
jgi:hypothetical protein